MKNYIIILLFLIFPMVLFSQDTKEKNQKDAKPKTLDAFADTPWGQPFESVREQMISLATDPKTEEKIEIKNEIEDKLLHITRNGINYFYRFYSTPEVVEDYRVRKGKKVDKGILGAVVTKKDKKEAKPSTEKEHPKVPDGKPPKVNGLYSVGVIFNYVKKNDLVEKMADKYGEPIKRSLDEKKTSGFIFWDLTQKEKATKKNIEKKDKNSDKLDKKDEEPGTKLTGGFILQWVEPYNKEAFSRRIDYYSAEIQGIIERDYKDFFSIKELNTLYDLGIVNGWEKALSKKDEKKEGNE